MSWLDGLKKTFRRGDLDAATLAIEAAINDELPPNIQQIAEETGVAPARLTNLAYETIATDIRRRVDDGIVAGWVPIDGIHARAVDLGLGESASKSAIENVLSDHLTRLVSEILADGVVDAEEDQRIARFLSMVGSPSLAPDTAKLIEDGRNLYRASTAPLTPVDAPVLLKKGEHCVYAVAAEALEERSRTVRLGYSGPSARVRVAKGIYYNVGSMNVSRQTDDYQHSFGVGVLCMTNKRLLWISEQKSISTPLSNIVRYDPYSDGIRIMKGTGKPLLFLWIDTPKVATVMAARVIEELRD